MLLQRPPQATELMPTVRGCAVKRMPHMRLRTRSIPFPNHPLRRRSQHAGRRAWRFGNFMQTIHHFRARPALHISFKPLIVALAAFAYPVAIQAQTMLEPVVITATRVAEPLGTALRDISAIDTETLRSAGIVDITDALRLLPGIELSINGPGATPSIFLRGANSNQTLVLIDGQRIGSSFSGLSALQHINVDQIERIEVLRGPAASLYGADAVGGVIQIFTRQDRAMAVRASAGEWRSSQLSANLGVGDAGNGLSINVSQNASRGYNAIINPNDYSYNPDRDGYRFNTAQVSGALTPTSALRLALSAFETRGTAQYDGDAHFNDRIKSVVNNIAASVDYQANSAWLSTLRVGAGGEKSAFDSTFPGTYQTRHDQLAWQNTFRISSSLNLLGGLERRHESVTSTDGLPVTTRQTTSALVGGDWTMDAWRINTSVRLDDSNQYGTRTTANGSLGYRFTPALRATINAGTSFKAPTFNDLYYPGYANPNLKPERGQSVDAGLHWLSGTSKLSATMHHNNVSDLIQFECDANYNCAPQNVSKARLQGLTFAGVTRIGRIQFDGSVDFSEPRDTTANKDLARRARQHGALKMSGDVLGVTSGLEVVASGKRYDNAGNSRVLPGYVLLNVHASKAIMPGVRVGVRVENATDRDYQLAYGYATGGRRAWLTLAVER